MEKSSHLAYVWSATHFNDDALSHYAEDTLYLETRVGLQLLAGLSLLVQVTVVLLSAAGVISNEYLTTAMLFGLLSLHIMISAAYVRDIKALHALGVAFLIIGALSIALLAHRSHNLGIGLMASVVLLFVSIPLVPWALREVATIIGLTYALLMLSLTGAPGRFEATSLLVLQLLITGAALIVCVVAARNTFIRKQDVSTRFKLEQARNRLELVSMQDYLTGAWNRRYLDRHFDEFVAQCYERGHDVYLAVLDIDDFKGINDHLGHQVGDDILISVAKTFQSLLDASGRGWLVRLGGDEFLILFEGAGLSKLITTAVKTLQASELHQSLHDRLHLTLSAGIASSSAAQRASLSALYQQADSALYEQKGSGQINAPDDDAFSHTASWIL